MPYTEQGTGYQGTDTSKAAAVSGAGRKVTLRDQVHELLKSSLLPLSSEEIAAKLNRPYGSIQPGSLSYAMPVRSMTAPCGARASGVSLAFYGGRSNERHQKLVRQRR